MGCLMAGIMDGWTERWNDKRYMDEVRGTGGWIDRWMDGWMDGQRHSNGRCLYR